MTDNQPKTDTPLPRPPSRLDVLKGFIGDIARPFAIWSTSSSVAWATVQIAWSGEHFSEAAIFIGAAYAGVAGLYWGKAFEVVKASGQAAAVETAKVNAATPTTTTTTTSQSGVTTTVETPAAVVSTVVPPVSDRPPWERTQ